MRVYVSVVLILLAAAPPAFAQGLALTARAGTGGVGGGAVIGLTGTLNLRAEVGYLSYTDDGLELDDDDVRIGVGLDTQLLLAGALLDWHPGGGSFRVSIGAVYNGIEGNGLIAPLEPVEAGGRSYSPAEVGDLALDIRPGSSLSPYAGIGFGNAIGQRVAFLVDIGALHLGAPEVEIDASQMLAPMEREAAQIEENLDWIQFYPVLSLGLSIRLTGS